MSGGNRDKYNKAIAIIYTVFVQPAIKMMWHKHKENGLYYSHIPGFARPFFIRSKVRTDYSAYRLVRHYYGAGVDIKDPKLIVDCGADIGSASLYYLHAYPKAYVVAIEPDPQSFMVLQKNLESYRDRVSLMNRAVWPRHTKLAITRGQSFGESSWSNYVRETKTNNVDVVNAITMDDIINKYGLAAIDIIKINIEGAEIDLFSGDCHSWLDITRNIIIEFHDGLRPGCSDVFFRALSKYAYSLEKRGEVAICSNITRKEESSSVSKMRSKVKI